MIVRQSWVTPKLNKQYGEWFDDRYVLSRPTARLFCFPFAGGSATFYADWADAFLQSSVELVPVQLPGRGRMVGRPCAQSINEVVETVAPSLQTSRVPVALFGHSMGAIIAFEVARRLQDDGGSAHHLFVSGRPTPEIHRPDTKPSELPRNELIGMLRNYGAVADEILENDEILDLLLPMIRADFGMIQRYRYAPGPPLACPISAWCGDSDAEVHPQLMEGWSEHTASKFDLRVLSGDHFFLTRHREAMVSTMLKKLSATEEKYESGQTISGIKYPSVAKPEDDPSKRAYESG